MAKQSSSPLVSTLSIAQRERVLQFVRVQAENCKEMGMWRNLLMWRDKAYQRTLDVTADQLKAQLANRTGDARKIQNLAVPIVMPQVESATAYQTAIFLSKAPIFGVMSSATNEDRAQAMEMLLTDQAIQFGWARELIKVFRNGFKYNFAPAYVSWKKKQISNVVTDTSVSKAGLAKIQDTMYAGNAIEAIDPYNCFMDMRVHPAVHHEEGEFFGWNTLMNRMTFKRFVNRLDPSRTTQLREAFESGYMGSGGQTTSALDYYVPTINLNLNVDYVAHHGMDWMKWAGLEQGNQQGRIQYKNNYLVTRVVFRALPEDFGGSGKTPTIYYAVIVNWKHVIYVEEVVSAHDYLPVFIMQPNEDGLGYQTLSTLDTALPFQDMSSALWNMTLESKRRQVYDRLIYNPRFIDKKDIDPANSVVRIPLRNASQFKGDEIAKAVFQFPYREDNIGNNIQMSDQISQMADVASGQNKVQQGQFQPGNKTNLEFQQTMQGSNARQQLVSMTIEHQFMQPVKETMKANILCYQQPTTLLNSADKSEVSIDPTQFRDTILQFKMTDGQLPIEQILNPQLMMVFMQTAQSMPVVMSEYDVMGMFIYWMKLQGADWLNDFKRDPQQQQQFIQTLAQTQQAQNAGKSSQQVPPNGPQSSGGANGNGSSANLLGMATE